MDDAANAPENNQASQPAPGTPEHDAAMAARFDAAQTPDAAAAPKATVPDFVPEKFRNAADPMKAMAEAYAALEAKQAGKPEASANQTPQNQQQGADKGAEALAAVGLDYDAYAQEFMSTGKLSEATYAAMAAKNIPRAVVDAHIAGQQALADSYRTNVMSAVGGEENFTAMSQWAAVNVPKDQLTAYNTAVDSGDINVVRLAVEGLYAKYTAANGVQPKLLGGGRSESHDRYESTAQLTADMRDPRYQKDPAFRASVEQKLARSNIM
nr:hypothetical protein [Methylobacterium sp. ZNC0032]